MGKNNKPLDPKVANKIMLDAGWKPLEPYKNTQHKWKSRCMACKKISYPMLKHVKYSGSKCRYCAGTLVDEQDAIRLMKKNYFSPIAKYPGSQKPWKSKCLKCGQTTSPRYSHVVQRGHCCKYCAPNSKVTKSEAIKAFKKQGFIPISNYINTKTPIEVVCNKCKQKILKSYTNLIQGTGCGVCAGNLPLDKDQARLFFIQNNLQPTEEFVNVNTPWKSVCMICKKFVSPTYGNVRAGKGCSYCSGNLVDPNDAKENMIKAGYKPLEKYISSQANWRCVHIPCGRIVSPQYSQIQQGYGGCMNCAPFGINMESASYIYLITNSEFGAHKIGIGNHKKKGDRLGRFIKDGWRPYKVWEMKTGAYAMKIEKAVFKIIRKDLNIPIYLSKEVMPKTEGHTETMSADSITLLELEKIVNKVIKINSVKVKS
jgi:hypothetical protein